MNETKSSSMTRLYLAVTLIPGYLLSILIMLKNAVGALVVVMSIPGLAAAALTLIEYKSIRALIAPFTKKITVKGVLFTFLYPLSVIFLCSVLALITKQGTLSGDWPSSMTQVLLLIVLSVPCFFLGLLEEYGWRGYLLPRLTEKYGLPGATWRVGILWSLFHLPALLMINLQFGLWNALLYTLLQAIAIFMFNFGFSYLYLLSSNVILPSIMHILWNNVNVKVLGDSYRAVSDGIIQGNVRIINGECLYGLIVTALFAALIWNKLIKTSRKNEL